MRSCSSFKLQDLYTLQKDGVRNASEGYLCSVLGMHRNVDASKAKVGRGAGGVFVSE